MADLRVEMLVESVLDGLRSIRAHKLRSVLTLTGIVFGVASVVSMFSIVAGIHTLVWSDFALQGEQECMSFSRRGVQSKLARDHVSKGITYGDAEALAEPPAVDFSTAVIYDEKIGEGTVEPHRFPLLGMQPEFFRQRPMVLTAGRSISALDLTERNRVAVVGTKASELLFGKANPIGRGFRLDGERYTVVGTVRAVRFRLIPVDPSYEERRIFVPVTTLMAQNSPDKTVTTIQLKARSIADVGPALRDCEAKLLQRHRGVKDYNVNNDAAEVGRIMRDVGNMMAGWNIVLGAIAIISLLVGGIGLFSIMQIAVRERVREIGIRKAIGADDTDIRREFLAESLTLSTTGGIAGILLAAGIILIAEQVAASFGKHWVIPISVPGAVIGLIFSAVVGFLFGLYPASKAARLNPIEAIRE